MKDRHNTAGLFALVGLFLAGIALPGVATAQDHPYHEFILGYLEEQYNITGGDFVLSTDVDAMLDSPGFYGEGGTQERQGPDPEFNFDYIHAEAPALTNPWDVGINWVTQTDVAEGETGLAVALIRGESNAGGAGWVNVLFERNSGDYDKSLDIGEYPISADWTLVAFPFAFHDNFAAGEAQFAYHLSGIAQWVDMTAPIVLNFHNQFSPEVLQGMIDSGGQIPTIASFTQSTVRGVPPFTVDFDASMSSAPGTITSYEWNFGDGATGSGVQVSHEYTAEGMYEVVLTVTDDQNVVHRDTSQVVGFNGVGLPESPLEIPFTSEAPTIDGTVDGVWSNAATVDITYHVNDQPPQSEADVSGTASVLWDGDNLYVLYQVTDDVQNMDTPDTAYQDDTVDLYVDGGNEKTTTYDDNDAQYEFRWGSEDFAVSGNAVDNGRADGVEYRWTDTATGYIIEARVPWVNVSTLPVTDTEIGIEFMISDADLSGPVRDTKLAWYGLQDLAYTNPSLLGTARLVGGEGQILTAHFSISAEAMMTEIPITFDASQSIAPGTIVSYAWDFGDGQEGEGESVQHEYAEAGQYTVTLTITDDQDKTAETSRSISISDGLGTPEKPLPIPFTEQSPVIDGVMDAIWETNAASVQLLTQLYNPLDSENDLLPTAYVMWDDDHIYVFYDIIDDVLITNDSAENERYKDDSVEFFLDPDNSKTPSAHDANDAQFSVRLDDPVMTGNAAEKYPNALFDMTRTDYGWSFEMAVPWSDQTIAPTIGLEIGIDFAVNDDDDGGERDHKASWFATVDQGYQHAHVFGTGILTEKLIISVAITGAFFTKSINPNQPITPAAIREEARQCAAAGASTVHIHVRDDQGFNTLSLDRFKEVVDPLREEFPELPIDGCLVAALDGEWEQMTKVLDAGVFDAVPVNAAATYVGDALFAKPVPVIMEKARLVQEAGAKVLIACYTDGDVSNADRYLIKPGLVETPSYWAILPGLPGCIPMDNPRQMMAGLTRVASAIYDVDPEATILVCAGGRAAMSVVTVAAAMGLHVRVGMEDTIWRWPHREDLVESNLQFFEMAKQLASVVGREIATPAEYRQMIGMPAATPAFSRAASSMPMSKLSSSIQSHISSSPIFIVLLTKSMAGSVTPM